MEDYRAYKCFTLRDFTFHALSTRKTRRKMESKGFGCIIQRPLIEPRGQESYVFVAILHRPVMSDTGRAEHWLRLPSGPLSKISREIWLPDNFNESVDNCKESYFPGAGFLLSLRFIPYSSILSATVNISIPLSLLSQECRLSPPLSPFYYIFK
ncbi:hypothetical protein M405DRAFT_32410 [Rhizopogon salebrosus TDB-379]|nr:hypothetical protein M405DRAFT_32410 [Rhizopogon salebrosus TDB-379]